MIKTTSLNLLMYILLSAGFVLSESKAEEFRPTPASGFRARLQNLANSKQSGDDLVRALLNVQTDLEKSIAHWEKQPDSDSQFENEAALREVFYLWEPAFKVALNPRDSRQCQERRSEVEIDANAGMPEGSTRAPYQRVIRILSRLCPKE